MATDPTTLQAALTTVLAALLTGAADDVDFDIDQSVVTVGPPATPGCNSVAVWVDTITADQQVQCQIASVVSVRWQLTYCIGADQTEGEAFWNAVAPGHHNAVWALWGGLTSAKADGTLCGSGVPCEEIQVGNVTLVSADGLQAIWQGTITFPIGVIQVP